MKVYTTSNKHTNCLNDYKIAFSNIFLEISQKLENENINTANMNSKIILEIQEILDQIDKFFGQDLYRDSPTGMINYSFEFILLLCIYFMYIYNLKILIFQIK